MGLDMYLFKYKKYKDLTALEVAQIESNIENETESENSASKFTSELDKSERIRDARKYYKNLSRITYREWDSNKSFPCANIMTESAYWRKANEVHKWFVDNVQNGVDDCGYYEVTANQLKELRDLCHEVYCDPDKAEELLPTQSGFFFGSYDYDDWYTEDIRSTIEQLDAVLDGEYTDGTAFCYHSNW